MVEELRENILQGKIDKVQQPSKDELVISVHSKAGNKKLYISSSSSAPRVQLINEALANPAVPPAFCMLLRKHLTGGRIVDIIQHGFDRIIEIMLEAMNELGFTLSKKIVIEIMGKHSNIILVDIESNKIIDSIKRVSIDTSRARQVLPGITYAYPPSQEKIPFDEITEERIGGIESDPKTYLSSIGGISPQVAEAMALSPSPLSVIKERTLPHIYLDPTSGPLDFHVLNILQYEKEDINRVEYQTLSQCIEAYFESKSSTNRLKQKASSLEKNISNIIEKNHLKLQRLKEDLLEAENSERYRLYGELLTANIHSIKPGDSIAHVISYYNGSTVDIPLNPGHSPSKNAQDYFKKYGKSKTAIKEKTRQIEETQKDLTYLESVQTSLQNIESEEEVEIIRQELIETGYVRKTKAKEKPRKIKISPLKYVTSSGLEILVGRNNKENDELTLKLADKTDIWLHTKDIPGSHVIIRTGGKEVSDGDLYTAASIAAWHSKARNSGQVPVDYTKVRHVKKPSGAKPGMVIFTDNRTLYVEPKLPV